MVVVFGVCQSYKSHAPSGAKCHKLNSIANNDYCTGYILTISSHRGFSPGSSAVILDIDYCRSTSYYYYYYDNNNYLLNFTEDCSIHTALQCSHDSDAAVECVGEWTNIPGSDFCHIIRTLLVL